MMLCFVEQKSQSSGGEDLHFPPRKKYENSKKKTNGPSTRRSLDPKSLDAKIPASQVGSVVQQVQRKIAHVFIVPHSNGAHLY